MGSISGILSDFKEGDQCIEQGLLAHVLFHGCSPG